MVFHMGEVNKSRVPEHDQPTDPAAVAVAVRKARILLVVSRWPLIIMMGVSGAIFLAPILVFKNLELLWMALTCIVISVLVIAWPRWKRYFCGDVEFHALCKGEGEFWKKTGRRALVFLLLGFLGGLLSYFLYVAFGSSKADLISLVISAVFFAGIWLVLCIIVWQALTLGLWEFVYVAVFYVAFFAQFLFPSLGISKMIWLYPLLLAMMMLPVGLSFRARWRKWAAEYRPDDTDP